MAGRYSRTYSRKKASAPPISQFDRLISEHGKSTHPVAAKTAGHVGKWGMTSFTSLRNISENLGELKFVIYNNFTYIIDLFLLLLFL